MKKNNAFTLLEVLISLALFALVTMMILSLFDFATSSTTETERAAEVTSNSSATKELLVNSISPSTSIEILKPISDNNLEEYIKELNDTGEDDSKYIYLYSIDGVVYYRNPSTETVGKEIKTISTTNVDLGFAVNTKSTKMLDINMTFSTKEIEPYVLEDLLSIVPLNFGTDEVIKDSRTDNTTSSNIIRYVSDEIIMDDVPVDDETPIILSATVFNIPVKNSPKGVYDIPFYVSQQPKVVQLYDYAHLADKGEQIVKQVTIDEELYDYEKTDAYFNNTVIGQSTFVTNNDPTTHEVSFVYKGYKFIDIYGNEYIGEPNGDGTRTIKIKVPTYLTTDNMEFAVTSESGAYVSYDFRVVTEVPEPEIVKFEFLPEDNNIPYKLKTYINQSDVYYSKENRPKWEPIDGTKGASRPSAYNVVNLGSNKIDDSKSFYSTIVMPTNPQKLEGDFYPNLGDKVSSNNLSTRVATITFKGTSLHDPDGERITIPETEWGNLNGVSEVTTKITIDRDFSGDATMLNGQTYEEMYKGSGLTTQTGKPFEAYTFEAYKAAGDKNEWFDVQDDVNSYDQKGKGYIFSVANGPIVKRYTYQNEVSTTKADFHKGTTVDSGLSRVWVEDYPEGAWVGGSMRGDVSGDIIVTVPYDKYDTIKDNVKLRASVYGKELIQLPSYQYGAFTRPDATDTTDYYSYYGLTDRTYQDNTASYPNPVYSTKTEVKLNNGSSTDSAIRYNADYLKHFVLIQNGREYGPMVRYQVKIEKSYPKQVIEPEIESIRIYESTNNDIDKTYIHNSGSFTPNSIMETNYTKGQKIAMNIAFAGAKIRIGTSIDPKLCNEFKNKITNKNTYYDLKLENLEYGKDYFIHLYDYQGDWKEAYMITTKDYKVRDTTVYDLNSEMNRSISLNTNQIQNSQYYVLPFLPVKTEVPGLSYGYHTDNTTANVIETPIRVNYTNVNVNTPVPYVPASNGTILTSKLTPESYNMGDYSLNGQNMQVNTDKLYIRSTRSDYANGGNNINTASQYRITNFMTPVILGKTHLLYEKKDFLTGIYAKTYSPGTYNTDNWVGETVNSAISERKPFETSNVKLDTKGFSVKIFNDRVYRQKAPNGTITERSTGRPGTVVETNYDIAIVDVTTNQFTTESYDGDRATSQDVDMTYQLPHDNSAIPSSIQTNDVLGYGFSLVEQNVDRDPKQDYLGVVPTNSTDLANATPNRDDREVALMFYVRHFVAGGGSTGLDLGKVPGTYVKIADLTGFDMQSVSDKHEDILYSQAVNFTVDIHTTFDGKTIITKNNYESIMKNNYIGFTVTELDIKGNPTGKVHTKMLPFADVFGGIRVDDQVNDKLGYNELNLILNHIPRQTKTNSGRLDKPRLSVGYGTNWGLVGISDFKIMR